MFTTNNNNNNNNIKSLQISAQNSPKTPNNKHIKPKQNITQISSTITTNKFSPPISKFSSANKGNIPHESVSNHEIET